MTMSFDRLSGSSKGLKKRFARIGVFETLDPKPLAIAIGPQRLTDRERFMRMMHNEKYRQMLLSAPEEGDDGFEDDDGDGIHDGPPLTRSELREQIGLFEHRRKNNPPLPPETSSGSGIPDPAAPEGDAH